MFGITVVPSVLLALGMTISPESPRWLFQVVLQYCAVFYYATIYIHDKDTNFCKANSVNYYCNAVLSFIMEQYITRELTFAKKAV